MYLSRVRYLAPWVTLRYGYESMLFEHVVEWLLGDVDNRVIPLTNIEYSNVRGAFNDLR